MKTCNQKTYHYGVSNADPSTTIVPVVLDQSPLCMVQKCRRHFMRFFLDFCYYLCVIPYKIVESEDGTYVKKTFIIQQFLCCTVQFLAVLDVLSYLRGYDYHKVASNPRLYFDIFISIVHSVMVLSFCHVTWKRGDLFCRLVQKVQKCPILSLWYPKRVTIIMSTFMLINIFMSIANPLLTFKYGGTHTKWLPWSEWYHLHVSRGRFLLFLGEGAQLTNPTDLSANTQWITSVEEKSSIADLAFAAFSYFAITCEWIIVYQVDILMNVMALTLWTATTYFINNMKRQENCKDVIRNYEVLKMLVGEINCIIGTVTLTYTVDSILFYATHLESIFTGSDWFSKVVVIEFFCSSINWLHFASMACLQMDQFREWIRQQENRSHLPPKSVSIMLLIDEISTNTVALSGNGLFTVNYKFVAQALTTLMTYFIIIIQFNNVK